ncbi:MAG: YjjG family noncanonical pyrimidine nucleotidase [Bdellovibrionales bacterium]|nr:YjjG family noncanonical pyrimidine nucleotidase [Bdellovibrionales bacterium]
MKYTLFLFDLDDTLLDFQASEKLAFNQTFNHFGITASLDELHKTYKVENNLLWKQIESGEVTKDFLKVERFKRTLSHHKIEIPPQVMADFYLEQLPKNVVLIDGAVEICQFVKQFGELGIITNGIEYTQRERIKNSALKDYIDFIAVSEECGFAKPDIRFFEFAVSRARAFKKESTIIVGDRIDADILGAQKFGIDSCWFNPHRQHADAKIKPSFVINELKEFKKHLG